MFPWNVSWSGLLHFQLIPGKYRDGLTQMMDAMVEYYYDQVSH